MGSDSASGSLGSGPPISATRRHSVVITEIVDGDATSVDPPGAAASEEDRRSFRLASKTSQTYEPVAERAMKLRSLRDALGGCTAALQKQVKKHAALDACAKPMRARAIRALAASICSSSSVQGASDD
jgi:hypothetical protein